MNRFDRGVTIASSVTLFIVLLSFSANGQAVTMEQYQHPKNENDLNFNKAYLAGIRDGLIDYNMSSETKLFCMPLNYVITFEQANDIAMRWAHKKSINADKLPLGLALLYGLKETFPCSK